MLDKILFLIGNAHKQDRNFSYQQYSWYNFVIFTVTAFSLDKRFYYFVYLIQ